MNDETNMINWIETARELLGTAERIIASGIENEQDQARARAMVDLVLAIREYLNTVWRKDSE